MNLLNKIRFVMTVNCRRASQLLSDRSERPLAGYERAALRFHMFLCGPCRRYARFLKLLRLAIQTRPNIVVDDVTLSPAARARLQQAVGDAL